MNKLVLNPAYEIVREHECNHAKTIIKIGKVVYEFCDVCMTVVMRVETTNVAYVICDNFGCGRGGEREGKPEGAELKKIDVGSFRSPRKPVDE